MNHQAFDLILARSSLESILRFIRSPRNAEVYNGIVVVLLVLIGLGLSWACIYLTKRFSNKPLANPRKLFKQLCRAHELSGTERRQLEQLAKLIGLDSPAVLMIDTSVWNLDELVRTNKLQAKQSERLMTLQRVLYEQPRLNAEHGGLN